MSWCITLWILVTCLICQDTQADDIFAKVGVTVTLPCNPTFKEPVDWRYQKDATIVEEYTCIAATSINATNCGKENNSRWPRVNVNVSIPDDYTLTINNASVNDSGIYHCVEQQGKGTRHTIQLHVTLSECASNPCQNSGTCFDSDNGYSCTCLARFTGTNCDSDLETCSSGPCQNGGECNNQRNRYHCRCPDGFLGINCEHDIDDCSDNPCQNNGTCIDGMNSYRCNCSDDYIGKNCSDMTQQHDSTTKAEGVTVMSPVGNVIGIVGGVVVGIVVIGVLLVVWFRHRRKPPEGQNSGKIELPNINGGEQSNNVEGEELAKAADSLPQGRFLTSPRSSELGWAHDGQLESSRLA